jgi:hypothetical protein
VLSIKPLLIRLDLLNEREIELHHRVLSSFPTCPRRETSGRDNYGIHSFACRYRPVESRGPRPLRGDARLEEIRLRQPALRLD